MLLRAARRLRRPAAPARAQSTSTTPAFAFDVDGVLYRGGQLIPSARPALERLTAAGVPWQLLTNGGGDLEAVRAAALSKKLGTPVRAEQLQLCHSPMAELAAKWGDRQVLLVGRDNIRPIAEAYGFSRTVTVDEYHAHAPHVYPDCAPAVPARADGWWEHRIEAVLCFMDPWNWARDLQVVVDVVRSTGEVGVLARSGRQEVPIVISCPDLEYVNEYPLPRFGAGAFGYCAEELYRRLEGRELVAQHYGKPNAPTYVHAEHRLHEQARALGFAGGVDRIYMVGDNPAVDVRGANNAGDLWTSVLVRTGIFQHGENDPVDEADVVVEDVGAAVELVLAA